MALPDESSPPPSRAGRRALAVRLIEETGGRAVGSPVAEALHPAEPPSIGDRLPLDKVPKDLLRRVIGRVNRLVVNRAGGALLRGRRVSNAELVHAIHLLEQRIEVLEAELDARRGDESHPDRP